MNGNFAADMEPVYMPEMEHADSEADKDGARAATGNGLINHRFCILAGSKEWEQWALSLPVDARYQTPIQNPDGSFVPMPGFELPTNNSGT